MTITLDGTTGITTPGLTNTGSTTIVALTTTGNTILGDASTDTLNVGNGNLVTDASGNVGIGTATPYRQFQVGNYSTNAIMALGSSPTSTGTLIFASADSAPGRYVGSIDYNHTSNYLSFTANASERMRIDSSGNLGLGVTPSAWGGALSAGMDFKFSGGIASHNSANAFYLVSNGYYNSSGVWKYRQNGYANYVNVGNGDGSIAFYTAASGTAGNSITFTQAMTLDASNGLYVGTSTTGLFSVSNYSASAQTTNLSKNPSDQGFNLGTRNGVAGSGSGTEIARLCWGYSGTDSAYISAERNGGTGANRINVVCNMSAGVYLGAGLTSWGSLSDERQKTNLEPITDASNKLNTLRAVTGRYITDEETVSRAFLIAQDVQKVLPEAVDVQEDEEGTLGLRYTDVIPLLVAAIKEQQALITTLTDRITALEAK